MKNSNRNGRSNSEKRSRVIALLTRKEIEFIDKLSMDALFSTGSKLSRIEVFAALVDAAMALNISAHGVRERQDLVLKIFAAAGQTRNAEQRCSAEDTTVTDREIGA